MLVKEKTSLTTFASPAYFFKQLLINNSGKTVGWDQTAHTPDHHKEANQVKIPIKLYLQMPPPSAIMTGDHDTKGEPDYQWYFMPQSLVSFEMMQYV